VKCCLPAKKGGGGKLQQAAQADGVVTRLPVEPPFLEQLPFRRQPTLVVAQQSLDPRLKPLPFAAAQLREGLPQQG
jgi:hypothetical protein